MAKNIERRIPEEVSRISKFCQCIECAQPYDGTSFVAFPIPINEEESNNVAICSECFISKN